MSEQPRITPLSEPEQEWVDARRAFAAQQGVDHLDRDAVVGFYDGLLATARSEEMDPDELGVLLDVVAVLIGEHLGARHGLQWVIVADEQGTDLGLRDPLSDAVVFPQSSVGQSWNDALTGDWIHGYVEWLDGQLPRLRAQARAEGGAEG